MSAYQQLRHHSVPEGGYLTPAQIKQLETVPSLRLDLNCALMCQFSVSCVTSGQLSYQLSLYIKDWPLLLSINNVHKPTEYKSAITDLCIQLQNPAVNSSLMVLLRQ